MTMGKRKRRQQENLWVATSQLPRTAGHPFYEGLNRFLDEHGGYYLSSENLLLPRAARTERLEPEGCRSQLAAVSQLCTILANMIEDERRLVA